MCKVEHVRERLCCKRHRALANFTCLLVDIFNRFASRSENSFEQGFTLVETLFRHLPHRIHSVVRYLHGAFGVWLRELHRWTFGHSFSPFGLVSVCRCMLLEPRAGGRDHMM